MTGLMLMMALAFGEDTPADAEAEEATEVDRNPDTVATEATSKNIRGPMSLTIAVQRTRAAIARIAVRWNSQVRRLLVFAPRP